MFSIDSFLKRELAGIAFGSTGVVIVEQSSGKIKNFLSLPYPVQDDPNAPARPFASEDIFSIFGGKEEELAAFLQKLIRDSKVDVSNVVVSLPPKDLIVRFFEMPNLPKSEVMAGITFEMKKYIPFKIEELAFDFQYRLRPKSNIIEVILCGMRQDPLDRYLNLLKTVNLSGASFEPGLFSLFRLLVVRNKINSQLSHVILDFDDMEANILIAEKGFPYFTRDIRLQASASGSVAEERESILFRLINEVRVSVDYYKRQFLKKDIDEMIIVSHKGFEGWEEHFTKELGIKATFVGLEDLLKINDLPPLMASYAAKAFGASLKAVRPSLVTLNLARSKEKSRGAMPAFAIPGISGEGLEETVLGFLKDFKGALAKGIGIGFLILVVGYGMAFSKIFPLEKEYAAAVVQQPPLLPGVDVSSLEGVQASESSLLSGERVMREEIDQYHPFYKRLIRLTEMMPDGVWLSSLTFMASPASLNLDCNAYAEEEKQRAGNINQFVMNLKEDEEFSSVFKTIELRSYRETSQGTYVFMKFSVDCRGD